VQQRVAAQQAPELSLRPRLLLALLRRPWWCFGLALDVSAFAAEAAALAFGSIIVVQPLLVSGLLWSVPLSTIGTGRRAGWYEWSAVVLTGLGLTGFLVIGAPTEGAAQASGQSWLLAFAIVGALIGCALVGARSVAPGRRAMSLSFAAGCTYALTAGLTKSVVDTLARDGIPATLLAWQLWVGIGVGILGFLLNQSAFQAGHLAASLPALAVTNPILSSVLGLLLFGERLGAQGVLAYSLTAASVAIAIVGVVRLASSPLVQAGMQHTRTSDAELA
jgi:hypothetical protein